jgi:uncharacterized iron-regulated protein
VVLLGETHDNAEHHRLQLALLKEMVEAGRRPALVMEQIDREFQPAVEAELARPGRTADSVLAAGQFNRRSWNVDAYRPLIALALEFDLPVVGANVSRAEARTIVRDPAKAGLPPVAPAVEQAIAAEIDRSHCGEKAAPAVLAGMVAAQRARDVSMARALERNAQRGGVLVAGRGHVRADGGVPLYLARRPLVIGLLEVDPARAMAADYLDGEFATVASFDYVWFTERANRPDPCAAPVSLPAAPAR